MLGNRNLFNRWCFSFILESLPDELVFVAFINRNCNLQRSELRAHFLQLSQVGTEDGNVASIVVRPLAQEIRNQIHDHFNLVTVN
jgi:hypothetical protein